VAKVTITIEDIVTDGEDGIRVSAESDPEYPSAEADMTIGQLWSLDIVEYIVGQATDVRIKDKEPDQSPTH
jgi:hypothetical protein